MKKYALIDSQRVIKGKTKFINLPELTGSTQVLGVDEWGLLGTVTGDESPIESISGDLVDNTDPKNPIIDLPVDDINDIVKTYVPDGGTATTYLAGDKTWKTPINTTYSIITEAEASTGTATTARAVSAVSLNRDTQNKIISYLLSLPNAATGNVLTINTAGTGFEWVTPA